MSKVKKIKDDYSGYVLLHNPIIFGNGVSEYNLDSSHVLKKPNKSQLKIIKQYLKSKLEANRVAVFYRKRAKFVHFPQEFEWLQDKEKKSVHHLSQLAESAWRYAIFEFHSNNGLAYNWSDAFLLQDMPVFCGTQFFNMGGYSENIVDLSTFYSTKGPTELTEPVMIDQKFIDDLIETHSSILNCLEPISKNAIQTYKQLYSIPKNSSLYLVGLFSILESIFTHKPRLHESLDSINHQIANKLSLVWELYFQDLKILEMFPVQKNSTVIKKEKIWKEMYGLRSKIAHEGNNKISTETKNMLGDYDNIVSFLDLFVRRSIKFSLLQSKFVSLLRNC